MGTIRLNVSPAPRTNIPIYSPLVKNTPPPLLPGKAVTVVWSNSTFVPPFTETIRPTWLMMPVVILLLPVSPSKEPT